MKILGFILRIFAIAAVSGCSYSTLGPLAPILNFENSEAELHPYYQAVTIEKPSGVSEQARYLGVIRVVTEEQILKAVSESFKKQNLLAIEPGAGRLSLEISFTEISTPFKISLVQPATVQLNYRLVDKQSSEILKSGAIFAEGIAFGIYRDATKRLVESARCAVRSSIYQLTYEILMNQTTPDTLNESSGGCQFITRYH